MDTHTHAPLRRAASGILAAALCAVICGVAGIAAADTTAPARAQSVRDRIAARRAEGPATTATARADRATTTARATGATTGTRRTASVAEVRADDAPTTAAAAIAAASAAAAAITTTATATTATATTATATITSATATTTTGTTATATRDDAATTGAGRAQARLSLWADVDNNFQRLGSLTSTTLILDRMKQRNIDSLILEVKPIHGHVVYPSKLAPRLKEWRGFVPDPDFDPVKAAVAEGRKRGLRVFLLANVFTGGMLRNPDTGTTFGVVFDNRHDWEAWSYGLAPRATGDDTTETAEIMPSHQRPTSLAVYLSPHNPKVREYQLGIVRELAAYKPDGIILDSLRFANIESDFSDHARAAFEKEIGQKVQNWPEDILTWTRGADGIPHYTEGHLFDEWLFFRAKTIRDFFAEATRVAREVHPEIEVEDNTGTSYARAR